MKYTKSSEYGPEPSLNLPSGGSPGKAKIYESRGSGGGLMMSTATRWILAVFCTASLVTANCKESGGDDSLEVLALLALPSVHSRRHRLDSCRHEP